MVTPALPFHVWVSLLHSVKLYFRLNLTRNHFRIWKTFTWLFPKINFKYPSALVYFEPQNPIHLELHIRPRVMNLSEGGAIAGTCDSPPMPRTPRPDTVTQPGNTEAQPAAQRLTWGPPRGTASSRRNILQHAKILPQSHCTGDFQGSHLLLYNQNILLHCVCDQSLRRV